MITDLVTVSVISYFRMCVVEIQPFRIVSLKKKTKRLPNHVGRKASSHINGVVNRILDT